MADLIQWILNNYGTISAVGASILSTIIILKRWGNHAIRSIMLGNKFYSIFGVDPAKTIKEVHDSIRSAHDVLEIRQQISERYLKIGIYICDLSGKCTWTNDYINEIFGLDSRDMREFGWTSAIHPDDRKRVHEEWLYSINNGISYNCEYTICNEREDIAIEVRTDAVAVINDQGIKQCYVGFLTIYNITDKCCECRDPSKISYEKKSKEGPPPKTKGVSKASNKEGQVKT